MKKILFALLVLTAPVIAEDAVETYDKTIVLPIDWTTQSHVNLSVQIPKGYQSIQPMSSWNDSELIEFIPDGEEANDWSEIITIQKLVNRRIKASQISQGILDGIAKETKATVLSKSSPNENEASFIVAYTYNGKDEVLGTKYLSGPLDGAGVQYTIRLDDDMTQQDAVKKIQDFFKGNLNVIQ